MLIEKSFKITHSIVSLYFVSQISEKCVKHTLIVDNL